MTVMGNKFMKQAAVAALMLMAVACIPAYADAQDVFADLAGMNQVESTYVSGRFAHNKKYWYSSSGTHKMDLSRGFSSMYSYQCYSEEAVSKAKNILKKYLKNNPDMEVMMKTTQGMQEYVVYEKFIDEGKKVTQMIIWNTDAPNVCEIVVINWNKGLERKDTSCRYDRNTLKSLPSSLQLNLENLDLDGLASLGESLGVDIAEKVGSALSGLDWEAIGDFEWGGAFDGLP